MEERQQYEYKAVDANHLWSDEQFNALGKEGWKLALKDPGKGPAGTYIFERPMNCGAKEPERERKGGLHLDPRNAGRDVFDIMDENGNVPLDPAYEGR